MIMLLRQMGVNGSLGLSLREVGAAEETAGLFSVYQ